MSTGAESFDTTGRFPVEHALLPVEHAWRSVQRPIDNNSPVKQHIAPGRMHPEHLGQVMDSIAVADSTHLS